MVAMQQGVAEDRNARDVQQGASGDDGDTPQAD